MDKISIESYSNGNVEVVSLSRPETLNALDHSLFSELHTYFLQTSAPAVVIAGKGKSFCAGADLRAMSQMDLKTLRDYIHLGCSVMDAIASYPGIVVAAVHGYALGGGLELALACDWIIGEETVQLGMPEVTWGLIPGFGGTQRLPKKIGMSKAKKMIFTGEKITGLEAFSWGLFDEIAKDGKVLEIALAWAEKVATSPHPALKAAKKALAYGIEEETTCFLDVFFTQEAQEKIKLFKG